MKRNLTIAVASIALAVPAIAVGQGGAHAVYEGHLIGARDSTVKLKESFGDLERAVKTFAVRDFTVDCPGDVLGNLGRTKLVGTIPVDKNGDFKASNDNGRTLFKVSGHIGGNKATGRFRYSGRVKAENGQTLNCDSGRLEWKAKP
jgi:hypothetical protein